jgi:acyl-coenzyme A synthetase/AMP-(fatty) acid ligase
LNYKIDPKISLFSEKKAFLVQIFKVFLSTPEILEAAVISKPNEKWGEVSPAFVTLVSRSI